MSKVQHFKITHKWEGNNLAQVYTPSLTMTKNSIMLYKNSREGCVVDENSPEHRALEVQGYSELMTIELLEASND